MKKILITKKKLFNRITLQSGNPYNIIDDETLLEISTSLTNWVKENSCRAVVLWGGENFAVGANLQELLAKSPKTLKDDERRKNWKKIASFTKPLIAAVNGFALGAGNELVMLSDIVVVGRSACLGQPEINLGLIPGAGGTQRLNQVGKSLSMEMLLTGRKLSAWEAVEKGLASTLCEDELTLETAEKIAEKITQLSPLAVQAAKRSVLQALENPITTGLEYEYRAFCELAETEDRKEGIHAFLEKRKPQFKGR